MNLIIKKTTTTLWIFERKMKTLDCYKVTQDYWFQSTTETNPMYWKNSLLVEE